MSQPAEIIADRFEIERLAGTGGMGQVFRARDRLSGEIVALKLMVGTSSSERFARESRLLAELRHPAIVRYVAHGALADGRSYLAMEWLEGETLGARLRRQPLGDEESLGLVTRVAEALAAAHARGIVHRDVKPGNVLLVDGRPDRAKLLDFGIAHLSEATALVTRTGAVLGTVGYMAPEQARGIAKVTATADVFALGALIFHCLTGRPPFVGGPPVAILAKLVLDEAPRLCSLRPELPRSLEELVARMLAKDPEGRPRDGAEVARALGAIRLDRGEPPLPPTLVEEALTGAEQRLVSVLLSSGLGKEGESEWGSTAFASLGSHPSSEASAVGSHPSSEASEVPTRTDHPRASGRVIRELRKIVGRFGGRLEPLRSGSVAVMLSGSTEAGGSATDLVMRSARCALALRAFVKDTPMALATGRSIVSEAFPVGEVIDRAAELLKDAPADGIALDGVTRGLLDARFEVISHVRQSVLVAERSQRDDTRLLLGRPTTTVGRERELSFLSSLLDECIAEPVARAVLVTGPPGIGKSRIRYELVRRARNRQDSVEIWSARGDPLGAGSPFGLLGQLIRRSADIRDGEPLAESHTKLTARVARSLGPEDRDRVTTFLGEIARTAQSVEPGPQLEAARRDPVLMGDQMRRAWEDYVLAVTGDHPLLLIFEDIHWGDLPTMTYVDAALGAASERPLMALALARPDVKDQFPGLWEKRGLQELRLSALTRKSAEKLAREVLGEGVDPALIVQIIERADGNAFYLEELIRAVAEGDRDSLPETVLAMVQSRLEALPDQARRVLRAASIFGGVFWENAVAALLGSDETLDVGEWLSFLSQKEIVTPRGESRFPGTSEWVFRHALVREAACSMLTAEDLERGHRLAGAWLEESGEPDALVLAEHYERGALPEKALGWCRTAAKEALEGNDFSAALGAARRALGYAGGCPDELRGELSLLEGEALYWQGDHLAGKQAGALAIDLCPEGSEPWFEALPLYTVSAARSGDISAATAVGQMLIDEGWADCPGGPALIGLTRVAVALVQVGQFEIADRIFERVEAWASSLTGQAAAMARWNSGLAARALYAGKTLAYLRLSREAAQSSEQAGDLRSTAVQRHNVGHACSELGDWEEAEQQLREVIQLSGRLGLANVHASAKNNLGAALGRMGRLSEARQLLEEAVTHLVAQNDLRMLGGARNHLAEVLLLAGDVEAAARTAESAVGVLTGVPPLWVQAMGTWARALRARGDRERALELARSAHERLEALGAIADGEAQVRLVFAELLHEAGRTTEAKHVLAAARSMLLARAAEMEDPALRQKFLERVTENARTLELGRAWGID